MGNQHLAKSNIEALKRRRAKAVNDRSFYQPLLDEALDYALPYRKSSKDEGKGQKAVDKIFDHTATTAAFRFAGNLQKNLWPTGHRNFKLQPGPLVREESTRDEMAKELEQASDVLDAYFQDGEWDNAFSEMALDLAAGTGAMLILPGSGRHLARFLAVPLDEIELEGGRYGDVSGRFWPSKWSIRAIKEAWPKARLGAQLQEKLRSNPEDQVTVVHGTVFLPKKQTFRTTIWIDGDGDIELDEFDTFASPWITPRYLKRAGETYGRGVIHMALPTIKTLNTASRLQLQAAAIAMLGIYTVVDDSTFNPDLSPLKPGAFWKVARNGGVLGPSVQRFPDPRLDLSNLILGDMRQAIKETMMDKNLPPDTSGVRSAAEIVERVKSLASDHVAAYGRLVAEIVVPVVQRVLEIAHNAGHVKFNRSIDQLLLQISITSPLGVARELERVETIVQWHAMVLAQAPEEQHKIAKPREIFIEAGRAMGVPEKVMVDEKEAKQIEDDEAARQAAAIALQAAAGVGDGA